MGWSKVIISGSNAHLTQVTASMSIPFSAPNVGEVPYSSGSTRLAVFDNISGNMNKADLGFIEQMLIHNKSASPTKYKRYFISGSNGNLSFDDIDLTDMIGGIIDVFMNGTYTFTSQFVDTGSMHYQSSGSSGTNQGSYYTFNIINASANPSTIFFRGGDVCPGSFLNLPSNETISFKVWRGDYITSHNTPPNTTVKTFWMPYGQTISPY